MRILVCDDNQIILDEMRGLLKYYLDSRNIKNVEVVFYTNGRDLVEDKGEKDIVFLDIEMPGMKGTYAGKLLKEKNDDLIIIVITSYAEYLDEAMRIRVFRYLSKPIEKERLFRNLDDAMETYNNRSFQVLIETRNSSYMIESREIIMVEAIDKIVKIYTTKETFESRQNLKYWSDLLPDNSFFRTHRSYIVNMRFVEKFDRAIICFSNCKEVAYVTKRKYMEFKNAYTRYLGGVR